MTSTAPTAVAAIIDDLSYAYDGVFDKEAVTDAVTSAWDLLSPRSSVRTYLPILVARQAREQLMALAQADGRVAKKVPELLFVCVHNAGRSQLAASLAERGVTLGTAYPKPLSDSAVRAADVIITMGCGDTCPYFPGKRYEDWDVADPAGQPIEVVREIRDDIQARVTTLLRDLLH